MRKFFENLVGFLAALALRLAACRVPLALIKQADQPFKLFVTIENPERRKARAQRLAMTARFAPILHGWKIEHILGQLARIHLSLRPLAAVDMLLQLSKHRLLSLKALLRISDKAATTECRHDLLGAEVLAVGPASRAHDLVAIARTARLEQ